MRGAARGLASRLRAAWSSVSSDPADAEANRTQTGYQNGGNPERSAYQGSGVSARDSGEEQAAGDRAPQGTGPPLADRRADSSVPPLLRNAAAWCWRLLLVAAVVYLAFKVADALRLVVIPLIAAMLLSALLQPLTGLLRRLVCPPWPRPGARCSPRRPCSSASGH